MRTLDIFALAAIVAATGAAGGACNWTEFDSLADETWVRATRKPDVSSSDYGVAIQRSAQGDSAGAGRGGQLVVLGTGSPTYSQLTYDASGESSFPPTGQRLPDQIVGLGIQPLLLAVPGSNDVSAVVPAGNHTAIMTGSTATLRSYQVFDAGAPTAATYSTMGDQLLVAAGKFVYGARPSEMEPNPHPRCELQDSTAASTPLQLHALGVVPGVGGDEVLVWAGNGKLYKYANRVFGNCTGPEPQLAILPIMANGAPFLPEVGSQILPFDPARPELVLLQGHSGDNGILLIVNATTMAPVGGAVPVSGLRQAAILGASNKKYVVAGSPGAVVDGTASGQVAIYEISATGIAATPVATLHDAQPEDNQSFGRAVAIMPFNGKQVIAVGADNEIFVYFRAKMANGEFLYDETRQ